MMDEAWEPEDLVRRSIFPDQRDKGTAHELSARDFVVYSSNYFSTFNLEYEEGYRKKRV